MKNAVVVALVMLVSGCSVMMNSPDSPFNISSDQDECYLLTPVLDVVLATAVFTTSIALAETKVITDNPQENVVIGTVPALYGTAYLVSALNGFGEYGKCRGVFPLFPEDE